MSKNFSTVLLFFLAFVAIALGGYQCSTRVSDGSSQVYLPIGHQGPHNSYSPSAPSTKSPSSSSSDTKDSLPKEPDQDSACPLIENSGSHGTIANFRFNPPSLEDFLLGRRSNFDIRCSRMILSMSQLNPSADKPIYKGRLILAFYGGGAGYSGHQFLSGTTDKENKNNHWEIKGTWNTSKRKPDISGKKFYSIFDNEKGAIILKLEDVRTREVKDGELAYLAAGDIYYKMFRIWTGDNADTCYNKGIYVSQAHSAPSKDGRCWLIGSGPFSCLPTGPLPPSGGRSPQAPDIDIKGSLPCYSRLGEFYNLNIEKAFNSSVDDL